MIMNRTLAAMIAMLLGLGACLAQTQTPNISFDEMEYDFGTIQEADGPATHKFTLKNTGAAPLTISNVRASCGCTSPDWSRTPIAPGQSGFVSARYNPAHRPGPFTKTITVYSNTEGGTTTLKIKGTVVPAPKNKMDAYTETMGDIKLQSRRIAFLKIYNNQTLTEKLPIINTGKIPVKVSFTEVPKYIQLKSEPAILKPNEEGNIVATFNAANTDAWEYVIDRVKIMLNDKAVENNVLIINANIKEDFSKLTEEERAKAPKIEFETTEFNFGTLKEGESASFTFEFKNKGKSDLLIRQTKASCGCTATNLSKKELRPGKKGKLDVTFNSKGKNGTQNKTVTIITNDPDQSKIVLWLKGEVVK